MIKDYKDKIVVVTGAGNGIGKALALGCAQRGANVVVNDIHADEAEAVAKEIRDMGRQAISVGADVSLSEECKKIFDATMEKFGRVDFLINNAGVSAFGVATEFVEQDLKWVTEVNVYSHFYMLKLFLPQMFKQEGRCQVLNVCSIAGLITSPPSPIYFATKHAAVALAESTWKWLKETKSNVDLAVFCPGFVQTEMYLTNRHRPERYAKMDDSFYSSDQYKEYDAGNKYVLDNGLPLDSTIEEVFKALEEGKFYILTHPQYDKLLREQGVYVANMEKPIELSDVMPPQQ